MLGLFFSLALNIECGHCLLNLLKLKSLHGVFNILNVSDGWLEGLRAPFACQFESIDLWLVKVDLWWEYDCHGIVLHENMREGCAEVSSVNIDLPYLWKINLFTAWAESLEP